jgi:Xaa-Pro aminopeptidase
MTTNWADAEVPRDVHPGVSYCAARRLRLAERFRDTTIIVPTGNFKVRANDTDYPFRAGTDFFYLTGCDEPDAVLVISPGESPRSTLYVPHRRDASTHEYYTDARYGELWVGARRGVREAAVYFDIDTAPLETLEKDLVALGGLGVITLRGFDASVDALHEESEFDDELAVALSELRLVKDEFEITQLQLAVDATIKGFADVVRALPSAVERASERVIEGVFNLRARVEGNDIGYETIAASGPHATTLHWVRNSGTVQNGDLLLLDAGVEGHELYTADVTRTMPINGTFSPAQRRIYDLVYEAQSAGIATVRPGATFMDPHDAAMAVLARGLYELGILKEEPEYALRKDRQLHRRYTLHGTSHMLGIDVHDCANARNEYYLGELREGYVLTVEPGLYFQPNDLTVPEEYRGIGVRIEDDVLVTAGGSRNLSAGLPRAADEVEEWMAALWSKPAPNLGL